MFRNMSKERLMQLVVFIGLIFLILLSYLVGIMFGQFYLIFFIIIIICGIFFILIELYLRVQHNINNKSNSFQRDMNSIGENIVENLHNRFYNLASNFTEVSTCFDNLYTQVDTVNKGLNELVDFNEALLQYFEDDKKERIKGFCELQESFKDNLESSKNIKDFQNKLVVLNQQILEYQKDQTNFLKEEVRKLKNANSRRKK